MGWSASLMSNKEITEDEIKDIVDKLPKEFWFGGYIKPTKQLWGWNGAVDIHIPVEKILNISGSYSISGNIAEPMAEYLKEQLEANGHEVAIEYNW